VSSRTWWAAGLLIVVLSLGLRVAYVEATPRAQPIHDAYDYDGHARSIAATGAFSPTLAHRPPLCVPDPPGLSLPLGGFYRLRTCATRRLERRFHVRQGPRRSIERSPSA
jgi:hypothetical protein